MTRSDKARRRALIRELKSAEYAEARARLGLDSVELDDLHDYLEHRGEEAGCDHTLRFTDAWTYERGRDIETIRVAVREFGGFCDCEVLANVTREKFGWPDVLPRPTDA